MMTDIEKIRALASKHQLGFLFNPGGGQFINEQKGVNIQIGTNDDQEDYFRLLKGLQDLGLEPLPSSIQQPFV